MEENVLSYSHVNIYQGKDLVLSDVSINIGEGEFIYLIGKTGTGKSSLIKSIYGEVPVKEGEARICGYDLKKMKRSDLPQLRRKLGIVLQDFQLLYDRTVSDNLDFVLKATGWKVKKKREERIEEVLTEVALPGLGNKMPYHLSGGEQQRLVIARALLNNPILFLADEPTGNLDPETSDDISVKFGVFRHKFYSKYLFRNLQSTCMVAEFGFEEGAAFVYVLLGEWGFH